MIYENKMYTTNIRLVIKDTFLYPGEAEKLKESVDILADTINSLAFRDFCLNFSWTEQRCTGRLWWRTCETVTHHFFNWNDGFTNEGIYNKLMSGKTMFHEADNTIHLELTLDRRRSRGVLGYTYPNTYRQWMYNWFFQSGTPRDIASNLIHEYCHNMGFNHAFRYHYSRQYTVPYAIGDFVARHTNK